MKTYVIFKYGTDEQQEAYEKDIISNFEAGLRSLGETAVSFEAIKSGVYGALSTFIGGPNVNSRILSGQAKGGKTNEESTFSYLGRKSPIGWRSGIAPLFDNASVAAINQEREEIAKGVNDFFEDKDNQDLFFNISSSVNWINAVTRAQKSGNQKAIRDARTSLLFSNVVTLESLEGTAYHDAVMESLNARLNFKEENLQDPESTESKAVFAYQNEVNNKTDNLSAEEALAEIKKSSKDLLDIYQRTKKEKESVEKLFGKDLDKDIKDAIIYNKNYIR